MRDKLTQLMNHFEQFPGIGPRQSRRLVYSLLKRNKSDLKEFGNLLIALKDSVHSCPTCGLYHTHTETQCAYCRDQSRNEKQLLVLEKDSDLDAVEKSNVYKGYYLILGGVVPISGKNQVNESLVQSVVKHRMTHGLTEIILGLSATTEGETTAEFVTELLKKLVPNTISITTLGRGLATGTEVEYSDASTLEFALKNRA